LDQQDQTKSPTVEGEAGKALPLSSGAPPLTAPTPPPHPIHSVFIGPDGLRSGWRFLAFVALWGFWLYILGHLIHLLFPHEPPNGVWRDTFDEMERLLAVAIATVTMMLAEKRVWGSYGLPLRSAFGKNFWIGAIWGFIALCVLMLSIGATGDFTMAGLALHGLRIWKFAAFWAAFFLLVGLFEEFLFRGYPQFTLAKGIGFWPAAIVLSILFGGVHLGNDQESWIGVLGAAVIGLFFCLTLRRTGTLWFAVGFHASWDWGESYFYSIADSGEISPGHLLKTSLHGSRWITGGSVGPEGSLFAFLVVALTWLAFHYAYPRAANDGGVPSSRTVEII